MTAAITFKSEVMTKTLLQPPLCAINTSASGPRRAAVPLAVWRKRLWAMIPMASRKNEERGVLATEKVRYPAEEWPRETVEYSIDRERKGQRRRPSAWLRCRS